MTVTDTRPPETPKKRRRVFPWVFLAVQTVFLAWVVLGGNAAQSVDCSNLTPEACQTARDVGTTVGLGLIIGLWVAVDFILGISYAVYRYAKRDR
jgi:hypothetical protein